jgi:hypothetical protein
VVSNLQRKKRKSSNVRALAKAEEGDAMPTCSHGRRPYGKLFASKKGKLSNLRALAKAEEGGRMDLGLLPMQCLWHDIVNRKLPRLRNTTLHILQRSQADTNAIHKLS